MSEEYLDDNDDDDDDEEDDDEDSDTDCVWTTSTEVDQVRVSV